MRVIEFSISKTLLCGNNISMSRKSELLKNMTSMMGMIVIFISMIIAYFIYSKILGNPANFIDGDSANQPLEGNYLGVIFKGGSIVILQITFMVILLTYTIERAIALFSARGKMASKPFVVKIKDLLHQGAFDEAKTACLDQNGAVANVILKGLNVYTSESSDDLRPEEKAYQIKRDLEEASLLEVPDLERNMAMISTIASIATLIGLLGTVTGMIRAFSALAIAGTPDAVGLASGISQALVTTALGISTAAVAIVVFNFFNSRIDQITYSIDESNYAILNQFKQEVKLNQENKEADA
jgi:biopolymer transport protein ExbB